MKKRAPLSFTIDSVAPATATAAQTGLTANSETVKPARSEKRTGREGQQFIAAHVNKEAAKQFKLLVVQQDKTTQDLLIEAINDIFAKNGLSRIA